MRGAAPFPYSNCSPQRKGRVSHETSRSDKKDSLNSHFPTAATRAAAGAHSDTPTGRAAVQSLLSQQPACTGPRGPRACRERPHGAVLSPHPTDGQRKNTFQPQSRARAGCASLRPLPRRCEAIDMEAAAAAGCERPRTRSGRRARSPPISTSGQVLHHGRMVEIGRFGRFFNRFLSVKHRIGVYDGLLCSHVVPSTR